MALWYIFSCKLNRTAVGEGTADGWMLRILFSKTGAPLRGAAWLPHDLPPSISVNISELAH